MPVQGIASGSFEDRGNVTNRIVSTAIRLLADRGFVVSRHPAARRASLMAAQGVDLVFDVGAAHGDFGAELRTFGYRGTIVSFEPLTGAFAKLEQTRGDDERWVLRNHALGSVNEESAIHVASNSDSSSLLPPHERHSAAAPHVTFTDTQTVSVRRLDDIAEEHLTDGTRALLKIDTQGFERQVLEGATETLRSCVGVLLELSFTPLYDGGMLADEAISSMYAKGYQIVGITPGFAEASGAVLQADALFWRAEQIAAP